MNKFKEQVLVKLDLTVLVVSALAAVLAAVLKLRILFSDIYFMSGLALVCLAVGDILVHASLMTGWFQHQRRGETAEEYQARKIDVHEVGSRKNRPLHWDKFSVNSVLLGVWLIVCAILMTA